MAAAGRSSDLVAAGALVTRKGLNGREVLLVHRPKYDDWSFPKGKRDPGEHVVATAAREVLEETGVEIRLGQPLRPQLYSVGGGRAKTVHYWVGRVVGDEDVSTFQPNQEIDQVAWFGVRDAMKRLTYLDDVHLLEQFGQVRKGTQALVVLRHARAAKRAHYKGKDDTQRPLTRVGKAQSKRLRAILSAYGITRVVSSTSKRCLDTVKPYADEAVLPVETFKELSEERYDPSFTKKFIREMLAVNEGVVVCTHRPVLPDVLDFLGVYEEPLSPAEMLVCHHRRGQLLAVERHMLSRSLT